MEYMMEYMYTCLLFPVENLNVAIWRVDMASVTPYTGT